MIRKKCMTCGTLHPLDHATECTVCDEDNWSFTCDKHPKLKLKRTSDCPECKAEKEAAKKDEEARKRKAAKKKRKKPPATHCPSGHGLLKEWDGQMRCWKCGWTSDVPSSKPKKKAKKVSKPSLKPHRGGIILFLGVISILLCGGCLTGIPAWLMGKNDLAEMDLGTMDPSGRTLTNAGRIFGKVVSIFWIIVIILYIV
jgi:hypothetical protein